MPPEIVWWYLLVQRESGPLATPQVANVPLSAFRADSGHESVRAEQHPQLAHEAAGEVDAELVGQAQHLAVAEVEEDL